MSVTMLVTAGLPKGSAMRGILQDLLSDSYQSSLPDKGGVPLPQDVVRLLTQLAACNAQRGRHDCLNGILPFVMTSCAFRSCSATSRIASHRKKPTAGFPGSSDKWKGMLPGVLPAGTTSAISPNHSAVHAGNANVAYVHG